MEQKGIVLEVQRQCIHDGDGVRSVLFLKGCPLRCLWCSNPESQKPFPEIGVDPSACIADGACVGICPVGAMTTPAALDRGVCTGCGSCEAVCYAGAIKRYGSTMTVEQAETELLKDAVFFQRGGGITISGGEPFAQPQFTKELLSRMKRRGIHTAVETCGYTAWENLRDAEVDQYLFDIKHMDGTTHEALTGVKNDLILNNLERLAQSGRRVVIRMPLIPGHNNSEENLSAVAEMMKKYGLREFHLLPFHQLSMGKYKQLDRRYPFSQKPQAKDGEIQQAVQYLRARGIEALVGG